MILLQMLTSPKLLLIELIHKKAPLQIPAGELFLFFLVAIAGNIIVFGARHRRCIGVGEGKKFIPFTTRIRVFTMPTKL
jgi:hypothetical protein